MKYGSRGCNAVGCVNTNDHRPTNTATPGFASPLQKPYLTRSNKDSIGFRLRLTCIRVLVGEFSSSSGIEFLSSKSKVIPTPPVGCFHPPRICEPRPTRMSKEMKEATKQGKSYWIFFGRKSCISARVTGNSPSAPASSTEEVDRWKVRAWSHCFGALSTKRAFYNKSS